MGDQAHALFGSHVRLRAPTPDRRATPRGAFAGIQKSNGDYYNDLNINNLNSHAVPGLEAILINDTVEKSRLHMQFAAIEAYSIYGISPIGGGGDFFRPPPPQTGSVGAAPTGPVSRRGPPDVVVGPPPTAKL